jgi:hypothetical protein
VAGSCELGNEPSGSIKCGKFLDLPRNYQLFNKDSALWSQFNFLNLCIQHSAVVFRTYRRMSLDNN